MSKRNDRRNLLHKELDVLQSCPECDVGKPQPFCKVCHGEGAITDLQLAVWVRNHQDGF